eukprot:2609332-Rhodomonas_salina.1
MARGGKSGEDGERVGTSCLKKDRKEWEREDREGKRMEARDRVGKSENECRELRWSGAEWGRLGTSGNKWGRAGEHAGMDAVSTLNSVDGAHTLCRYGSAQQQRAERPDSVHTVAFNEVFQRPSTVIQYKIQNLTSFSWSRQAQRPPARRPSHLGAGGRRVEQGRRGPRCRCRA